VVYTGSWRCSVDGFKVKVARKGVWLISTMYYTVQERLTREIAEAVLEAIQPTGVGVVIEATYVANSD
jgi:GTP cyclohydrolase I